MSLTFAQHSQILSDDIKRVQNYVKQQQLDTDEHYVHLSKQLSHIAQLGQTIESLPMIGIRKSQRSQGAEIKRIAKTLVDETGLKNIATLPGYLLAEAYLAYLHRYITKQCDCTLTKNGDNWQPTDRAEAQKVAHNISVQIAALKEEYSQQYNECFVSVVAAAKPSIKAQSTTSVQYSKTPWLRPLQRQLCLLLYSVFPHFEDKFPQDRVFSTSNDINAVKDIYKWIDKDLIPGLQTASQSLDSKNPTNEGLYAKNMVSILKALTAMFKVIISYTDMVSLVKYNPNLDMTLILEQGYQDLQKAIDSLPNIVNDNDHVLSKINQLKTGFTNFVLSPSAYLQSLELLNSPTSRQLRPVKAR